ncbi:MAG: orotate phosphoribosyltransferase [Streptococcaceae bacterium]|jgi:orotate phosphoribosyltransferase|nr:orotate phosphoribosyltransferase [Streptococcaceae bacterium]
MLNLVGDIAKNLLEIKAVFLSPKEPFTWTSGIKAPIYTDNRITMSFPKVRRLITKGFAQKIKEVYPNVEVIAGVATAGIPHAAWVAEKLNLPLVYIRSKPKDYGKEKQIEGKICQNAKMVVIEDLISTGGSVLKAVAAAKREGADVLGVAAIFTYELSEGLANFKKAKVELSTLSNYTSLIKIAKEIGYVNKEELSLLKRFKKDQKNWQ